MSDQKTKLMKSDLVSWLAFLIATSVCVPSVMAQSVVSVVENVEGFQLLRNGKPYRIRGVGGKESLDLLAAAGGNSIRTWSADGLDELLDAADANGLSVCVGMWLGHERHGFDYQDRRSVAQQRDACLNVVRRYKDHPAVLLWAIGNEMEGDGKNLSIWSAIDSIASEVKKLDANHPTMTVIAELGENEIKVRNIERYCPNIDVIGVNSYGGIISLASRYRKADVRKPYIVTEHGPAGPWEVQKTPWNSPIEATSTAKAEVYAKGYRNTVMAEPQWCFGTYAFLWGHKQETTATWFGMFLSDGTRLAAVDAMSEVWTGGVPNNRCPRIAALHAEKSAMLKPGEVVKCMLDADDPENDPLKVSWILRKDSGRLGVGGDAEREEATFNDAVSSNGFTAMLRVPDAGGAYRLFAIVKDDHGGGVVANVPLQVDAASEPISAPRPKFPFLIYADGVASPYAPSGYMGNTNAVEMIFDCGERPHSGSQCLKVQYNANDQWAGVLWQSPANDWTGSKPGGFDLTGASAIEFYVRGERGDEIVSFVIGGMDTTQPYRDTAKAERKEVRLTTQWQKVQIPLNGLDLGRIKTGFGWSVAGQGGRIVFYLDDIQYVR